MEKTKETSNREQSNRRQAISWWNNLPDSLNNGKDKQSYYDTYKANVYTVATKYSELTGREIQNIWAVESELDRTVKPNKKQFAEFNEDLFKAYIAKFSEEDKVRVFEILFHNSNKWDGINNAAPFYMAICQAYNAGKQAILLQKAAKDRGENFGELFVSSDTYFKKEFNFK